jgi:hypothetical protein
MKILNPTSKRYTSLMLHDKTSINLTVMLCSRFAVTLLLSHHPLPTSGFNVSIFNISNIYDINIISLHFYAAQMPLRNKYHVIVKCAN